MSTKRDGIVLMMTLVLITLMMGIVALFLTQSERFSRLGSNAFSQSASLRIVNDLEQQLPSLLSNIKGAEELDFAIRLPLQLESKKRDFSLKATLASPYGRLNINRVMGPDGKIDEGYVTLLMRVFRAYPIADSDIFMKLVFDTIDTDADERGPDTEIAWAHPEFKNGMIVDSKQFVRILERYIELTRDTAVLAIPWDRYIGYEGEKMDFNAITPEVLALVLPDLPPEKIRSLTLFRTKAYTSKEELIALVPSLGAVFDNYFFLYKPGEAYNILCDVRIHENSREEHVHFQYNLLDKKVRRVEFL